MKKYIKALPDKYRSAVLIVLILSFAFAGKAQVYQVYPAYGGQWKRIHPTISQALPNDTFAIDAAHQAYPHIAMKTDSIYVWNTTLLRWQHFSGGSTYTASRGLNLSVNDFRLGGSIDSTVVLTVNNHNFKIDKTTSTTPFIFTTLDTVTGGGAGLRYAGVQLHSTLRWPSYSATGYTSGADVQHRLQIKDSAQMNTQGGDYGGALKVGLVLEKLDSYSGRSVMKFGELQSNFEYAVPINLADLTYVGTSTTSNYKYGKGYVAGHVSYLVMPANDTLENWIGFHNKAFLGGHVKYSYDYPGGHFGNLSAARVANPWFLYGYSARSKSYIAGPTGIGDSVIATTAILDIKSTAKGILIPRMTTAQKNAIVSPATSLLVFDTDLNGYYFWDGAAWTGIGGGLTNPMTTAGDIIVGGVAGAPAAVAAGTATYVLTSNGAGVAPTWQIAPGAGGGITTLNTLTDATQTFATGTAGTDFGIVSAAGAHTFNIPDASASNRGLVTTGSQTYLGLKTHTTGVVAAAFHTLTGSAFGSNLYIPNSATGINVTTAEYLTEGAAGTGLRMGMRGSTSYTVTANSAYAPFIIGAMTSQEATTGTHPLKAGMIIKVQNVTNAAGATANLAGLYIEGPPTGVTPTGGAYAAWLKAGSLRLGGNIEIDRTITGAGTTGNQTINLMSGTVNIAAAGTTVTVTNSFVTANSIVFAVIRTNDSTALLKNVVPAAGSFVINLNAAATAETSIGFLVTN